MSFKRKAIKMNVRSLKVLFMALGDRSVASSRARVYSYLPYLTDNMIRSLVIQYTPSWQCGKILSIKKQNLPGKIVSKIYSTCAVSIFLMVAPFFDVVYIQKVVLSKFTMAVLRLLKKNIIFDFDDAIHLHRDIGYLLKGASCVVVSNSYLRKEAMRYNDRVYTLISPVSVDYINSGKESGIVSVGWLGSPESSKYLGSLITVFKSLGERFSNVRIELMGAAKDEKFIASGAAISNWSLAGEKEFLRRIDIGIMPLEDDDWSRGKGGYKILQYMAAGIPSVVSPVGVNKEIVEPGLTGFFAVSEAEWFSEISKLVEDSELRRRMGKMSFKKADSYYSYEANISKLAAVLKECRDE